MADLSEDELGKKIDALALKGVDIQPLLKRIMVAMQAETKKRFQTSTAPDGSPWAKLVLRKGKPLWDTGSHLLASCTATNGPDAIREIGKTDLRFGTSWEFAHVHQDGATIQGSPFLMIKVPQSKPTRFLMLSEAVIPARPFLGWNEDLLSTCEELVADYAVEKLGG